MDEILNKGLGNKLASIAAALFALWLFWTDGEKRSYRRKNLDQFVQENYSFVPMGYPFSLHDFS